MTVDPPHSNSLPQGRENYEVGLPRFRLPSLGSPAEVVRRAGASHYVINSPACQRICSACLR